MGTQTKSALAVAVCTGGEVIDGTNGRKGDGSVISGAHNLPLYAIRMHPPVRDRNDATTATQTEQEDDGRLHTNLHANVKAEIPRTAR